MAAPALKRLTTPGLKRSTGPNLKVTRRTPLDFVPEEPNPLANVKPAKTKEEQFKRELDAFGTAFREAMKKEQADTHHELEGYGAECFLMVFRDAHQATAFLQAIGYPQPKDCFIDGLMVADLLDVKLPEAKVPLPKKLKTTHDPKLARLVKLK